MRQLLSIFPPRMVSRKCVSQSSAASTLPMAAAMAPSAITVCALPSSDLHTTPTEAPWPNASIAARRPAPPRADDQHVVLVSFETVAQNSLTSRMAPQETSRTYKSVKPTERRLAQANSMLRWFKPLSHCQALWRGVPTAAQEKQSSPPPARWRRE